MNSLKEYLSEISIAPTVMAEGTKDSSEKTERVIVFKKSAGGDKRLDMSLDALNKKSSGNDKRAQVERKTSDSNRSGDRKRPMEQEVPKRNIRERLGTGPDDKRTVGAIGQAQTWINSGPSNQKRAAAASSVEKLASACGFDSAEEMIMKQQQQILALAEKLASASSALPPPPPSPSYASSGYEYEGGRRGAPFHSTGTW